MLPKLLVVNTGLHNPQQRLFWQTQMDKVVAKVITEGTATRSSTPTSSIGSTKPCRYGDNCSRPGCRFRHSFDPVNASTAAPAPPIHSNNLYCSNNWLPLEIALSLDKDRLDVCKFDEAAFSGSSGVGSDKGEKSSGQAVSYYLLLTCFFIIFYFFPP